MKSKYFQVLNAFSNTPFGGNPAAIFYDASNINEEMLQPIARQLNLVETVFVYPSKKAKANFKLRYFTPHKELPIAGHPTIATWVGLAKNKIIDTGTSDTFYQETANGIQEIKISIIDNNFFVWMEQLSPIFKENIGETTEILKSINLSTNDLHNSFPIAISDTGLSHLIIPLESFKALEKAKMNLGAFKVVAKKFGFKEAQIFTFDTIDKNNDLFTRNICPREGLEDPACGVGTGALGAYLARYKYFDCDNFILKAEQGHLIDKPSLVTIKGNKSKDNYSQSKKWSIWTGGTAVLMMDGNLLI